MSLGYLVFFQFIPGISGCVCDEHIAIYGMNLKNWNVDEHELIPFSFDVGHVRYYPDGRQLTDNAKHVYCAGESLNEEHFYCLQPTHWQKGVLDKHPTFSISFSETDIPKIFAVENFYPFLK